MGIKLAVAEIVEGRYQRQLRRYRVGAVNDCPVHGYHNASVNIGEVTDRADAIGDNWPHHDWRWPTTCDCGYKFVERDNWQRNDCRIIRTPDGQEYLFFGSFGRCGVPAGTMVRAEWADEFFSKKHPQHVPSWIVALPDGGEWITSQAASGGGFWTVNGTPPNIDVNPSIWHNQPKGWHGFIRHGEMVNA